jgi:Pyruvate/2-oxoacid:ferredoxin oxidoreductase delta subunit
MPAVGLAGGGFAPIDIILVMDRSGSMDDDSCVGCSGTNQRSCRQCGGTWTYPPQPITDAKNAAKVFVDLNNPAVSHIGLASYASDYGLDAALTANYGYVKTAIDRLSAQGCTNAAGGLLVGRNELNGPRARPDATHVIVFLTDGLPNQGLTSSQSCKRCPDYCPAAKQAARQQAVLAANDHITIYTIALGSKADRALMQDIAEITGGLSYYAPTSDDLETIYRAIFEQIRLRLVQ